jgi:hypothetical protein
MKSNPRSPALCEFVLPGIVLGQSFLKIVTTSSISFLEFFAPEYIHVRHSAIDESILRRRRMRLWRKPLPAEFLAGLSHPSRLDYAENFENILSSQDRPAPLFRNDSRFRASVRELKLS